MRGNQRLLNNIHDTEYVRKTLPLLLFSLQELAMYATVGTGTFGRVRVVQHKPSGQFFALKILKKSEVRARACDWL